MLSIGCLGKIFAFKYQDEEVGFRLKHGSLIIVDEFLSGAEDGSIKHGVFGEPDGSITVSIDFMETDIEMG